MENKRWLLGITGASGAIYAARFLHHMHALGCPVDVMISDCGREVLAFEEQLASLELASRIFVNTDMFAAPASGSARYVGMAVLPCSMGTLGRMAAGISDSLLTRAADVCLKERRPLVLCPREMPLSQIHLENLLRLQKAGAIIIPASPSFYRHPKNIEELVDSVVVKVLDHLQVDHQVAKAWGSP
jgi:4-hydroxy-3-polyprenylbenzoate decarboxylase